MRQNKKMTLQDQVKSVDDSKKVNPLDLSSDQDLTIALMNMISLEEHFAFSGAKTQKSGYYDLINTVRDMRRELMGRIVGENTAAWDVSERLLAASMRLIEVGTKALGAADKSQAYKMFDRAYELYSLFWGVNMGLIDLSGVKNVAPDIYSGSQKSCPMADLYIKKSKKSASESRSTVKKLGDWVKNAVNCCIE